MFTSIARIKDKDVPKDGKIKFKPLVEVKEIKNLLEGSSSPVKTKVVASKGITPAATTAATSRGTQSPTRKPTKRDEASEPRKLDRAPTPTPLRKTSAAKVAAPQTPVLPKGLQSAYKGTPRSPGSKTARKFKVDILGINELIDIDFKQFERSNKTRLHYILNNLFGKDESAKKKSVEKSAEKSGRSNSLSKLKITKKRVSDVHLNVGLGKRVDPFSDDERREARIKWERINIKKDHLKKFTEKDKRHRVL